MTSDLDIAKAAIAAGFPALQTPTAIAVALAESGGNAAKETATHKGLWQLATPDAPEDWANPVSSAKAAKTVFDRDGWQYWPTWRSNAYLLQMPRGAAAAAAATALNPPLPEIPNPFEPVQELADQARRGLNVVTDRDLWIRIGLGALGAVILIAAITALLLALTGKGLGSVTRVVIGSKVKAAKNIAKGS